MMRRADWLVDVGPDAGQHGGRVLYSGPPEGLAQVKASHTRALPLRRSGARCIANDARPCAGSNSSTSRATTCTHLDVRIPVGAFTAVTGVSGSGKSSLVSQALVDLVGAHLGTAPEAEEEESEVPTVVVDRPRAASRRARRRSAAWSTSTRSRSAARRAPTSPRTPACSITCASCFAATKAAKARRYDAGRFSFNVAKGRCPTLRRRRLRQRRTALHAERVRAVPDVPRRALQREDARSPMARQEHRRGPRR